LSSLWVLRTAEGILIAVPQDFARISEEKMAEVHIKENSLQPNGHQQKLKIEYKH
jgi:hypothetical protein